MVIIIFGSFNYCNMKIVFFSFTINSIHHLSDFLPQWKGLDGQMSQSEFKNILSYLSLPLNEEEFRKLWNRYDPKGKGVLTGTELMSQLGVSISSSRPSTMSSVISGKSNFFWFC